jgi:hypothetical protein
MAKITLKGLQGLRQKLGSRFKIAINKTLRDKQLRQKIGEIVESDIRETFKAIPAPATKQIREYYEKYNPTHPAYSRNKINITFTGELLRDLITNVKADTTRIAFIVEHSNKKHKLYKLSPKSDLKRKVNRKPRTRATYREIQGYLAKLGYDYLEITPTAADKITDTLREVLLKNVLDVR